MSVRFSHPNSDDAPVPPTRSRTDRDAWAKRLAIAPPLTCFSDRICTHESECTGLTFRDVFCRRFDIPSERFEIAVLQRCLSRRARLLRPLIRLFARHYFSFDAFFVQSIGRVRNAQQFTAEVKAFRDHSRNRDWLRRRFKLRLSVWRILDLADEVMPHLEARQCTQCLAARDTNN